MSTQNAPINKEEPNEMKQNAWEHDKKYKCQGCKTIIPESFLKLTESKNPQSGETKSVKACPVCGETAAIQPMCENDHICYCHSDMHSGVEFCPVCGSGMCPCGSHDVAQISRITGYLSDVAGWNAGKRAELQDRTRVDAISGSPVANISENKAE